jgi:hypothetical protein
MLVRAGLIDEEDVRMVLRKHRGVPIGKALVLEGVLSGENLTRALGHQLDCPVLDLSTVEPSREALAKIPAYLARRLLALPFRIERRTLHVAMADPMNEAGINELRVATMLDMAVYLGDFAAIESAVDRYFSESMPLPSN